MDTYGHLDAMLLAVLEDGPLHGYGIVEQMRERSDGWFDLKEGTVYPALHRLEHAGLLSSQWSVVAGRRRRVYVLTSPGREAVAERRTSWTSFRQAVDRVLSGPQVRAS